MSWNNKQKGIVKAYQRYAGMPDQVYREKLREYTGCTSSTDDHLTGRGFEIFMPFLESSAHLAHINKCAKGKKPWCIKNWHHWRNRYRQPGSATHAQLYRIEQQWHRLCDRIDVPATDTQYLLGIAAQACGRRIIQISDLREQEALWLIEALKDRLRYATRDANKAKAAG